MQICLNSELGSSSAFFLLGSTAALLAAAGSNGFSTCFANCLASFAAKIRTECTLRTSPASCDHCRVVSTCSWIIPKLDHLTVDRGIGGGRRTTD